MKVSLLNLLLAGMLQHALLKTQQDLVHEDSVVMNLHLTGWGFVWFCQNLRYMIKLFQFLL